MAKPAKIVRVDVTPRTESDSQSLERGRPARARRAGRSAMRLAGHGAGDPRTRTSAATNGDGLVDEVTHLMDVTSTFNDSKTEISSLQWVSVR